MKLLTDEGLKAYCEQDWLQAFLQREAIDSEHPLTCQRWLTDSAQKRFATDALYRNLLTTTGQNVLDIGGGLTTLQRLLAKNHDYELLDILAHDGASAVDRFLDAAPSLKLHKVDWLEWRPTRHYDVIVANDLFPNVDQRLALFLDAYLPYAAEIRLSLTFYNTPRYYPTRRLDGDEIMYLMAWNGEMLEIALRRYADRISNYQPGLCATASGSIFPNGRQVVITTLAGDA